MERLRKSTCLLFKIPSNRFVGTACALRGTIARIWYVGFEKRITLKYGVVLENWPLEKFAPPGNFCSIPVLNILKSAFEEGRTFFRTMDDAEWNIWKAAYHAGQNPIAVTWAPSVTATPATAQDPAETPSHDDLTHDRARSSPASEPVTAETSSHTDSGETTPAPTTIPAPAPAPSATSSEQPSTSSTASSASPGNPAPLSALTTANPPVPPIVLRPTTEIPTRTRTPAPINFPASATGDIPAPSVITWVNAGPPPPVNVAMVRQCHGYG